jgi:peptidoglycan/xylan/chitin deacetylase (PgdA/CDA1 family)
MRAAQSYRLIFFVLGFALGAWLIFLGSFWWGMALHWILVTIFCYGTFRPASCLFGGKLLRSREGVWLTIDDGPDPETTPQLLAQLAEAEVRATFFLIGERVREYPELANRIVEEGHAIGNHSETHPRARFWAVLPWQAFREIQLCQRTLAEVTRRSPVYFRPPVGHANPFIHPVLRHLGLELVGWSSRGFDGVGKSREDVRERIAKALTADGIVLMHEGTPIASEVLEDILVLVKERGWEFTEPAQFKESSDELQ